jgi:hypothetical protein
MSLEAGFGRPVGVEEWRKETVVVSDPLTMDPVRSIPCTAIPL